MRSQADLDAIVAGLRDAHRELQTRLTGRAILRILAREHIARRPAKIPAAAMTVMQYGRAAIIYNPDRIPSPREEVAVLAEEYAHAKLHVGDPGESVVHISSRMSGDPREYEADYVARCLLAGPDQEVAYFRPAPKPRPRAKPARLPIGPFDFDPYSDRAPIYGGPRSREPNYAGASHHIPRGRQVRERVPPRVTTARSFGPDREDPNGRIEITPDGKRRYHHPQIGVWTVYDIAFFDVDGVRTRTVIQPGHESAKFRYFRAAEGMLRFYQFSRLEPRAMETRHLERQLRQASTVPQRREEKERAG